MKKFIRPIEDSMFKHILETNKEILAVILSNLIEGLSYEEVLKGHFINSEMVKTRLFEKGKRTDLIYVIGNDYYNIEANSFYYDGLILKNNTYIKKLSIDKIKVGKKYINKSKFIQVNFNAFNLPNSNDIINRFKYYDRITRTKLEDNIEIIHINVDMFKNMAYNEYRKNEELYDCLSLFGATTWEEIEKLSKKNKYIKEVKKKMEQYLEEDGLGVYDAEEEAEMLKNTFYDNGLEKGKKETQEATAKEMLKEGLDDNLIAKITKLSLKKIKKLKVLI